MRTWRKRLSNLNTFLTPHIYWGIHITICVNYNQHNRSAAQKNPVNKICLLLVFSVPTERAAIATGNDLRGLGICHQQALAGIPETGFLLNTQSYVRLHCLPVVLRVFGRGSVYSCRIDKPLITAYNRVIILNCYNREMQKNKIFCLL